MTLAELDQHIETFKQRSVDQSIGPEYRAVFKKALEGALKQREELIAKQTRTAKQPSAKTPAESAVGQGTQPGIALSRPEPAPEKKTLVWTSAPTAGMRSPSDSAPEIVVECDLEAISTTVIVFRWGKDEERLTPGLTMCRFKARVDDVAKLERKKPRESRCFHRSVAYYAGLVQFCGRELNPVDFGFRGRKARVLENIQEAYREQKASA